MVAETVNYNYAIPQSGEDGAVWVPKMDAFFVGVDGELKARADEILLKYTKPTGGITAVDLASAIQDTLDLAASAVQLDDTGKIPNEILPSLALITWYDAANEAAMLALTVQAGDGAVRADDHSAWVFIGGDSTLLTNWKHLTVGVTTVNGQTGDVTVNSTALLIAYNGTSYPLRSTATLSSTTPVTWVGPVAPTVAGGYAIAGIDLWINTTEVN